MSKNFQVYKKLNQDYQQIITTWDQVMETSQVIAQIRKEMCAEPLFYYENESIENKIIKDRIYKAFADLKKWKTELEKFIKETDKIYEPLSKDLTNILLINDYLISCKDVAEILIKSIAFDNLYESDPDLVGKKVKNTDPEFYKFKVEEGHSDISTKESDSGSFRRPSTDSIEEVEQAKEVDKVLEKIENHEKPDVKSFIDKLNYVGEEGESIVSFILKNSDFNLKNEICSQKLQKQKVSNDVKITINSAMSYTEMPVKDVQELIGHVFDNNIDDFGVC